VRGVGGVVCLLFQEQQQLPAESKLCGATSLFCKVQILKKPEKQPEEGEHVQKASAFLHMIKI